jgi:hypothetical protein
LEFETKSLLYEEIFENNQFFKYYLTLKDFYLIRGSMYKLITTLCKFKKEQIIKNIKIISPLILGIFINFKYIIIIIIKKLFLINNNIIIIIIKIIIIIIFNNKY